MNLAQFSVTRPVTLVMIVTGILIFGVISLELLPQELFPQIVYPQLTVVSPYANAAPEEIETLITKPIEEAIGTVAGVKRITSISKEGLCLVMAEFSWNQNINFAALGMREKLDLIKERLPREAEEPVVLAFNPFDKPILGLSVTSASPERSPLALREISRRMIKDEVEKVDGVAAANISGGLEREIIVDIDRDKLQAASVALLDVTKAISNANLNYPAGTIKESFYEYLIRTLGEFERVRDIEDVVIGGEEEDPRLAKEEEMMEESIRRGRISKDKRLIYLKDVATVTDGLKERTSYSRYNGTENISISVQKQSLGNTVQIIDRVKKKLQDLKRDLPKDVDVRVVYDQSLFIKNSIAGVWDSAWQGGVLVFFVLLYFLRNIGSSLIVTFTIPISVMATFALMFFSNISLNMMSLGGLAFGVGSLVDCAIVAVENIFRHMQMGKPQKESAAVGANEVFISITGSVLTTVVVFLPLIFVIGIVGQITKDFALTVSFSLIASLMASMTIIPLLASKFVKVGQGAAIEDEDHIDAIDRAAGASALRRFYSRMLERYINKKWKYLALTFLVFLLSLGLFLFMDVELMPKVDQGQFMVKVDMPAGTRLTVTNRISEGIEKYIMALPVVESVSVTIGSTKEATTRHVSERLSPHQAEIIVNLKKKRGLSSSDVVQNIKNALASINLEGAKIEYVLQENVLAIGMGAAAPITIELKGNKLDILERLMNDVQNQLIRIEGVYGVKNSLPEPSPETKIHIDKDKASLYGLSVVDIAQTAQIALKGYVATKFKERGEEFDVRARLRAQDREDFDKLARISIRSPFGVSIPLSGVASFTRGRGPSEIKRFNQQRTVLVYANVYKRAMKDIAQDVNRMLAELKIPKDYTVKLTGESEEMKASFDSMKAAIIAAFLLVYMIMAALFESLWQPFIIMFTIPLSLIGVAAALFITHTSISAYVFMGVGILGGIVVNNAIVLIDCINLFLSRGMTAKEAVIAASKVRLRPILMTALTTILGLVPMAFLGGEGSELRSPMAITVMGGLTLATFLTLVVVPSLYLGYTELIARIFKRNHLSSPPHPNPLPLKGEREKGEGERVG